MPRRSAFIFTYGTLMSSASCDAGRSERAAMEAFAVKIGPGSIRGRLYDAGLYPAAVLDRRTPRRIHGEIWQLPRADRTLLDMLDRYEGCGPDSPEPHPYFRVRVQVRSPTLNRVASWMYVWRLPTMHLPEIHRGRWRAPASTDGLVDVIDRTPHPSPDAPCPSLPEKRAGTSTFDPTAAA